MRPLRQVPRFSERCTAFSLLELLAVMAIMAIIAAILIPVFGGRGQDMSRASNSISDILQQARTRAMSKNTYVYVGVASTQGATPELAVAVVESKDGLPSDDNNLVPNAANPAVQSIQNTSFLRGIQLNTPVAEAKLPANSLPTPPSAMVEKLETSQIRFPANLVTRRGDVTDSEFKWVIQFSPDGAARLDATKRTVSDYILFGLIPATGDAANSVGVIIDGPSGAVRTVRPGV